MLYHSGCLIHPGGFELNLLPVSDESDGRISISKYFQKNVSYVHFSHSLQIKGEKSCNRMKK